MSNHLCAAMYHHHHRQLHLLARIYDISLETQLLKFSLGYNNTNATQGNSCTKKNMQNKFKEKYDNVFRQQYPLEVYEESSAPF